MNIFKTLLLLYFVLFTVCIASVRAIEEEEEEEETVDPELQGQRVGSKTDEEVVKREEEKMSHDGFSIQEKKKYFVKVLKNFNFKQKLINL